MPSHTFSRARYGTELLARVAAGWRRLAEDQRRGVVGAARVAADLAALDAPPALLMTAGHVLQEEIHHLEVCARVIEEIDPALPALPVLPRPPVRSELSDDLRESEAESDLRLPRASISSERSLARALVVDYALGKPVSAAAFAAARAIIREPLLAWAYTELLHDESRHATFGARAAAWVIRRWSASEREALWTTCLAAPSSVAAPRQSDPEAEALGLLPAEVDCALPRWILPHLEPLGLHPRPANDQTLLH
ncbi:MAG TPA: hypothetical protein VFG23_05090 [Polyangia bacterium]|nr:hypothetical protein [Polyangia bacterium]